MSALDRPSAQRFISSTLSKVKVEVCTTGVATGPPTPRWTSPACTAVVAAPTDLLLARLLAIPLSSVGQTFLLALSKSKSRQGETLPARASRAPLPNCLQKNSTQRLLPLGCPVQPINRQTSKPKALGFFFNFFGFLAGLVVGDDLLLELAGDEVVVGKLSVVAAAAL